MHAHHHLALVDTPQLTPSQWAAVVVDQVECGLVVCDRRRRILFANRAARREMDSRRALQVADGIVEASAGDQLELSSAIRDAALRSRCRLLALEAADGGVMVVVRPITIEGIRDECVVLMIGLCAPCSPLGFEMLAMRHRLTPAESRVLKALLSNRTARQISTDLVVSIATVRTQIQAIREKFGARSIDELMLQVARMPPIGTTHIGLRAA